MRPIISKANIFILILAAILMTIFALSNVEAAQPKGTVDGFSFRAVTYLRTIDGDTVVFNVKSLHPIFGVKLSIRVRGVDTPELRSKDANLKAVAYQARDFTKNLMDGATRYRLSKCVKGTFSRIVCDISSSKTKNLGNALLKAGLAVIYKR